VTEVTSWREVSDLRPGDPRQVDRFEIAGRLGEGGMGVVYLAHHPEQGPAAIKFVRTGGPDDAGFRARFQREIAAAERVSSPRVARLLGADAEAEVPWLATAFVDGPTLHEAVDDGGPMTGERLVSLAVALADALAAVHDADIVHRDMKPSNIMLTPETPVVIDFGIAALRDAPALTQAGTTLGTPGWMAPEQVKGQPCGPTADVFAWGLVVAFAASGKPPFGSGPADALFHRIVHESPDLPRLPDPLAMLVPAALAKDPALRPDVGTLLARLTGQPVEPTAIGRTLADRTAVVPTVVALGWDVEALPTRPGGQGRAVPHGNVPPSPEGAAGAGAFWYAGEDHRDLRSLAAAFQTHWEDAVDQVARRRDPIWIGELRGFLAAAGAGDADRLVAAGPGDAPPAALLARLVAAMDPHAEPRVGAVVLTPDGLTDAAQAVTGGGGIASRVAGVVGAAGAVGVPGGPPASEPGARAAVLRRDRARTAERLGEVASARILRLWRGLPGMERAAAIDERWHAGTEAFGRFVSSVAPHAGWPSPEESQQAAATLLLCAVHPEHERQLERRLASARRSPAKHQSWWAQLAAEGQRNPPAAVLAVMTAERARSATQDERAAAKAVERERRESARAADQQRRAVERGQPPEPWAPVATVQPRFVPVRQVLSSAARAWSLALLLAGLVVFLWADQAFSSSLVRHYLVNGDGSVAGWSTLDAARDASGVTGWAVALIVLLVAVHIATRVVFDRGTRRLAVRAYAGGAAVVDLVLGVVLVRAATLAVLVLSVGASTTVGTTTPSPFDDRSWGATALLLPYGAVGVYLVVRSLWRLVQVVLGRPVAAPFFGRGVRSG
jgi:hypothetical protein